MIALVCTVLAALPLTALRDAEPWSGQSAQAPFKGLAIDRDSGEPLAGVSVKVYGPGCSSEVCTTDAEGRFATVTPFAAGRLQVYPWDNHVASRGTSTRLEFDGRASAGYVPVRLRVGPRIELEFLPLGSTRLTDYRVGFRSAGVVPGHACYEEDGVLLHEGAYPWIRLGPARTRRWEGRVLYLLARDGLSCGRVVLSDPLDWPQPVRFEWCGAISLRIEESVPTPRVTYPGDPSGDSYDSTQVSAGMTLEFKPVGPNPENRTAFHTRAPIGHPLRIGWIQPGRWEVELRSPFFPAQEETVLVQPGLAVPLEVRLGAPIETGELCIRLRDPSGDFANLKEGGRGPNFGATVGGADRIRRRYVIQTRVFFCDAGIDGFFRRVERDGHWVMEVVLRDVPMGEYRVVPSGGAFAPGSRTVRPGETASFDFVPEQGGGR